MNESDLVDQLVLDEEGIYRSRNAQSVSYPKSGNMRCFMLEDSSYWFQHRNRCITSVIKSFPPGGPIIDVGGGNGYVTRGILDAGFDAVLLEPGADGALNGKIARQIPLVICSTFKEAAFKCSSLSAIGCFDVIEHIEDDQGFIEQTHRALKPDGLLYATVPAFQWLWSQSDDSAKHYRRYNKAMIKQLLSSHFEVLYFSYFFSLLTIPIFVLRSIPYRLGLTKKKNILSTHTEHGSNKGGGVHFLNYMLEHELKKIEKVTHIHYGASCLFVARKLGQK